MDNIIHDIYEYGELKFKAGFYAGLLSGISLSAIIAFLS
jgi:hypothetical protein